MNTLGNVGRRGLAAVATTLSLATAATAGGGPSAPFLNEFVNNHTGTDTNEYVEIIGDPNTDYSAYTIVEIEGDSPATGLVDDATYAVGTTDANGIWWTGFQDNVAENGTVTFLLVTGFTGTVGDDIDLDDDGVIDNPLWTAIVDSVSVTDGGGSDLAYGAAVLDPAFDGGGFTVGGASFVGGAWVRNDFDNEGIVGFVGTPEFGEALNTPGLPNEIVPPLAPVINEFVVDTVGTDVEEFVEILGSPNADYSTYTIVEIEGDSPGTGLVDDAILMVGTTDANGLWVSAYLNNVIENGSVSLLLVKDFTGGVGDDIDLDDDGVIDNPLWSEIVDSIATSDGGASDFVYGTTDLPPGFDGDSFQPGGASRIPNGVDTDTAADWVRNDFDGAGLPSFVGTPELGEALNTPGAFNETVIAAPAMVFINEVDSDTESADVLEFIELYDGGAGNTALDGLVVVLFNGSGDVSYAAFDLDGFATDANGFFLLGNTAVVPAPGITFAGNLLQNGADGVAVYIGNDTDWPNGTAATSANLVDAVVYDTDDADATGLLALLNPGQFQINEAGNDNKDFDSVLRFPDGGGGFLNTDRMVPGTPTPGASNDTALTFMGSPSAISLASGGAQAWELGAGATFANELYVIAGSLTGTMPGTGALPINLDTYTLFTLSNPNSAPLAGSLGFLDAGGDAAGSWTIPAGLDPSLAGAVFHHAYGVISGSFVTLATSNPIPLELIP